MNTNNKIGNNFQYGSVKIINKELIFVVDPSADSLQTNGKFLKPFMLNIFL